MATEIRLPSWLSDVSSAVSHATNVVQTQSEIEALASARGDLAQHVVEFGRLVEADSLGRGTWWAGQTAEPIVFSELQAASTNPQQRVVNSLLRNLDSYARTVNAQMITSWREYAARRMGNVGELQLLAGTLASIKSVAGLAANLQQVLGQLGRIQAQPPTRESLALLDEAEKRFAVLEAALQPIAVREFLAAVARGGASIALLTDEVRAWLALNRAELSFKITAGTPDNS